MLLKIAVRKMYCEYSKRYLNLTVPVKLKLCTESLQCSSKSDEGSEDKDSKRHTSITKQQKETNEQLHKLLQIMAKKNIEIEKTKTSSTGEERFTKVRHVNKKTTRKAKKEIPSTEFSQEMEKAVNNIANVFGGDIKKTKSELLSKLLTHGTVHEQKKSDKTTSKTSSTSLHDIVSSMKVEHTPPQRSESVVNYKPKFYSKERSDNISIKRREKSKIIDKSFEKVDLFGGKPFNIFTPSEATEDSIKLTTWEILEERDLKLAITHPPANIFEEMILWTEKGKLWKFPINNEEGLEDVDNVHFTEHIFLEKHLETWCPQKGPIRHFMELVCVGLSKNPYMSVQEKIDNIVWYKSYFSEKNHILKELQLESIKSDTATEQIS